MIAKELNTIQRNFLDSLLKGDRNRCSALIHEQINNKVSVKYLYENVIKEALYEIGSLWESNKISVATEHLASAIVEAIINEVYPSVVSKEKIQKRILLASVEKEHHQIGLKMVNDIFESRGWDTYFLGANTPTSALISFANEIKPHVFSISLSLYFHFPMLEILIQKIRTEFPETPILVGGQAFTHGGQDIIANYSDVIYLSDLNKLDLFIKKF